MTHSPLDSAISPTYEMTEKKKKKESPTLAAWGKKEPFSSYSSNLAYKTEIKTIHPRLQLTALAVSQSQQDAVKRSCAWLQPCHSPLEAAEGQLCSMQGGPELLDGQRCYVTEQEKTC